MAPLQQVDLGQREGLASSAAPQQLPIEEPGISCPGVLELETFKVS